jgi:hypothetical protein
MLELIRTAQNQENAAFSPWEITVSLGNEIILSAVPL